MPPESNTNSQTQTTEQTPEQTQQTEQSQQTENNQQTQQTQTEQKTETQEQKQQTQQTEFTPHTAADIKLPEGMEKLSDELINEFVGLANESKFSPELRDKLVGLQGKAMQAARDRDSQLWNDLNKTWKDELAADKELGGQNTEAALAEVNKLMQTYGGRVDEKSGQRVDIDKLVQFFDTTAGGNNLHVIRFLHNIAKALNEGKPTPSGQPQPGTERTLAQRIHPNHNSGAAA